MKTGKKKNNQDFYKDLLLKKNRDKDSNEKLTALFKKVDLIRDMKIKDEHLADITASMQYKFIRKN